MSNHLDDDCLQCAWEHLEKTLTSDWEINSLTRDGDSWWVAARSTRLASAFGSRSRVSAEGATPTAAIKALTLQLHTQRL